MGIWSRLSGRGLFGVGTAVLLAALVHGCEEESALSRLGEGCRLDSDCDAGLSCIFGGCHEPCATTKDCPDGRCVIDANRRHHCQLESESGCSFHSECPAGLVCGVDGRCRNECAADRDCVAGQKCVGATCAEPSELDAGRLPTAPDVAALGQICNYSSECPASPEGLRLVCRQARCAYDCFEERDCGRFETCSTSDDPEVPGECRLIGEVASLFCDPEEDPVSGHSCACPGGSIGSQYCLSDGSGYQPCDCP